MAPASAPCMDLGDDSTAFGCDRLRANWWAAALSAAAPTEGLAGDKAVRPAWHNRLRCCKRCTSLGCCVAVMIVLQQAAYKLVGLQLCQLQLLARA